MSAPPAGLGPGRRTAIVTSLLAGGTIFLAVVNRREPIATWLVWTYLRFLAVAALFVVACVSAGHLVLSRGFKLSLPVRERIFMSFAVGMAVFGWGMCVLGHLHLYGRAVAWLWPLACAGAGAPAAWSYARRLRRHARRLAPGRASAGAAWVRGFGFLGVLLIYAGIMSASVAGYDARWYHLALAEHYTAAGGIVRFPEGFFGGAWPHFASWLYTWAFLVAGAGGATGGLFRQIEQALHVELAVFAATLVGLPVLVRFILRGRRVPHAWVAVFLFPGIFLYDSSLNGTADHVLALWALALLLTVRRAWRGFDPRACVLFGVMAAATASTKYQSIDVLAFPLLAFGAAAVLAFVRRHAPRRRVAGAVGLVAAAMAVLWSPHWLKNLLWYGDPLYPLLRGVLADRPWQPAALPGFAAAAWRPTDSWPTELARAVGVLFSFSFSPHDWPLFHRDLPVFGSLFTLALAPLAFLPRARRAWLVAAAALLGVWTWYFTYHQDRYLQALLPWMAAVVAAVVVRLWDTRDRVIRAALALVVTAQIVWGASVPFLPTHVVLWRAPVQLAIDLLSTGYRGDTSARIATASNLEPLAPLFGPGARVLVHESEPRLGTGTQVVTDARGAQGGIDYAAWRTPARIAQGLRSMGVTHLVWPVRTERPREEQLLSNELAFVSFVARALPGASPAPVSRGALIVGKMPDGVLPDSAPVVGVRRCEGAAVVDASIALDDVDRLLGETAPVAAGRPLAPDVWLQDERCNLALPDGYRASGHFPPFIIATAFAAIR